MEKGRRKQAEVMNTLRSPKQSKQDGGHDNDDEGDVVVKISVGEAFVVASERRNVDFGCQ